MGPDQRGEADHILPEDEQPRNATAEALERRPLASTAVPKPLWAPWRLEYIVEAAEIHSLGASAMGALGQEYAPQGFNLGWNLGRIAGAGILDHVHLHVVPRWTGDTNFMPVLADVKVLPEHLLETARRLRESWPS